MLDHVPWIPTIPWWGWGLIVLGAAFLAVLVFAVWVSDLRHSSGGAINPHEKERWR